MQPVIDHVVYAGSDLERLRAEFDAVGLTPSYGGEHSNGVTHNYTVGFADLSYVELISKIDPDATSPWWDVQIDENSGPAAWALAVEDVEAETERLADRGFAVDGPTHYQRERPDGELIEWDLTVVGDRDLGTHVPFLLSDRTPRAARVNVEEDLRATGIAGIDRVVVATDDLQASIDTYRRLFDCDHPTTADDPDFEATLAHFDGLPMTLATPLGADSWLRERVDRFGPLPCAYLLRTTDPEETTAHFDLSEPTSWVDGTVRWFDLRLPGRVGVFAGSDA